MNINGVKKALPYLFESNLVGLLIGTHGVGKSTSVRELFYQSKFTKILRKQGFADPPQAVFVWRFRCGPAALP